jgi:hypothetical protein
MELNIMESGKMINSKGMAKKNGKTVPSIVEIIEEAKNKEKELLYGVMTVHMKESFIKIIFMDRANICGKMVEYIVENGTTIKCMGRVHSLGQMDVNIKDSMKMIKNMDLEYSLFEMAVFMKGSGKMENNMEVVFIKRKRCPEKEYGTMELE